MPNPQHTPGPWRTDPECDNQIVLGPDGFIVADCAILSKQPGAPTDERCKANARLIAVMPDLLAALKRTTDALNEWVAGAPDKDDQEIIVEAFAVIAKGEA